MGETDNLPDDTLEPKAEEVVNGEDKKSAQEELDELRPKLAEAETNLEKAQDEAKSHQKNVTKKAQEVERLSRFEQEATTLKQQLEDAELRNAILEDQAGDTEESERKPQIGSNVQKILDKRQSPEVTPQQEAYRKRIGEVTDFITEAGFDPENPEFAVAAEYAVSGMFAVAKREAEQVINAKKKEPDETEEKMRERIKQEVLRESGSFKTDNLSPSGTAGQGIPTDKGKFQDWLSKLPQKEFERLAPEINKMMEEGKIK